MDNKTSQAGTSHTGAANQKDAEEEPEDNMPVPVLTQLQDYTESSQRKLIQQIQGLLTQNEPLDPAIMAVHRDNLIKITDECLDFHQRLMRKAAVPPAESERWVTNLKERSFRYFHIIVSLVDDNNQTPDESIVIGTGKGQKRMQETPQDQTEAKRKREELELRLMQAKRKADEEMFLTQLGEKRKMEDIRLKALSEQRTIQEEIEKQQLQNSWTATPPSNFPGHTSTPTRGHKPSFQPSLFNMGSFNSPMMQQTMNASSIWLDTFVTKMRTKLFDGSPKDWPHFIASYESFVHNTALPDHQKLLILNDVLSPEVRKIMAYLLQSPNTYEAAINELQKRYGDKIALVRYHIQGLLNFPICKSNDHQALYEFSSQLHDTVATMQALGEADKLSYGAVFGTTSADT